jgi:hypothetical protein
MTISQRTSSAWGARKAPRVLLALLAAAFVAGPASNAARAQGKDDLWEITTRWDARHADGDARATQRLCIAKSGKDDDYIPKREGCRVQDSKRVGNKVTYKMVCTGRDTMTVAGETTFGTNSYDGKMAMSGKMDGQQVEMNQTYSGKRVGDCTAK